MRKPAIILLTLFVPVLLASCGGAQKKVSSPHLFAGSAEIAKGAPYHQKGCYKRALEHYLRAHEIFTSYDQREGVAMSLNNLGTVYLGLEDPASARVLFDEAYRVYTAAGNAAGARQALSNKAAALIDLCDLDGARETLEKASRVQVEGLSRPFIPLMSNTGVLLTKQKEYQKAEEVLGKALAAVDPDRLSEAAVVHSALGNLMLEKGDYRRAVDYFEAALGADRGAGFYKGIADDLRSLGQAHAKLGDDRSAVDHWQQSVKIYALLDREEEVEEVLEELRAAAARASVDIELTEFFVSHWLEGEVTESLCD